MTITEAQVTVSHSQVREFFRSWEQDHRDGKCRSPEEEATLSVEQIADANAKSFWDEMHPVHTA